MYGEHLDKRGKTNLLLMDRCGETSGVISGDFRICATKRSATFRTAHGTNQHHIYGGTNILSHWNVCNFRLDGYSKTNQLSLDSYRKTNDLTVK